MTPLLENFLKFEGKSTFPSLETALFIREAIEVYPEHRASILEKICSNFNQIKSHLVIRVALWILGEYAQDTEEIGKAFNKIKSNVGSLPIYPVPTANIEESEKKEEEKGPQMVTKTVILPDGSYGTQTVMVDNDKKSQVNGKVDECTYLPLRNQLVTSEDDFLASCLAVTLAKLVIKSKKRLSN